jgi:hypothetical protein
LASIASSSEGFKSGSFIRAMFWRRFSTTVSFSCNPSSMAARFSFVATILTGLVSNLSPFCTKL